MGHHDDRFVVTKQARPELRQPAQREAVDAAIGRREPHETSLTAQDELAVHASLRFVVTSASFGDLLP